MPDQEDPTIELVSCYHTLLVDLNRLQEWVENNELSVRASLEMSQLITEAHRFVKALATDLDGGKYPRKLSCRWLRTCKKRNR
jgi:hypothetical protein